MQSDPNWPTPIDTTIIVTYPSPVKSTTMQANILVPANAPPKGVITITPISQDVNGQDGSSNPTMVAVRAGAPPAPKVLQLVGTRIESKDTLFVTATGSNIAWVGFEALNDSSGALIKRDSVAVNNNTPLPYALLLNFSPTVQGKKVRLRSFAYDGGGRLGYSVRATGVAQTGLVPAIDTALVVYGRTYSLPVNRNGSIADLAVDPARGNVFLSNLNYGRLEVWQKSTQAFDATGVVVGSQPWGITMSRTAPTGDTLYVANSGGTNLSRVYVGAATASGMKEDLNNRLLTRVSFMFKLTEVRDVSTGKIRLTVSAPITYSDRPQYVEQSSSGRLYVSTKPTAAAPLGTVRYMDPSTPAPDERFILAFATPGADPNSWLVANVDNATVTPASATSTSNDALTLCDHPSGTTAAATCVTTTSGIQATINALAAAVPQTDVEYGVNLDESSLGLSDTTFAASSGDGKWISFGEGNTRRAFGRDLLLRDDGSVPGRYTYASPAINVDGPDQQRGRQDLRRRARQDRPDARHPRRGVVLLRRQPAVHAAPAGEEEHLRPGCGHHLPPERGRNGHTAAESTRLRRLGERLDRDDRHRLLRLPARLTRHEVQPLRTAPRLAALPGRRSVGAVQALRSVERRTRRDRRHRVGHPPRTMTRFMMG